MSAAPASDAALAWRSVQSAAGYRIYVRQAGQQRGPGADVGRIQADMSGIVRYIERGLQSGVTNYLAVSAYNAVGVESVLSNEMALNVAATPAQTPQPPTTANATASRTPAQGATSVFTSTATPTPGSSIGIRGTVHYYVGGQPVSSVSVIAQGGLSMRAAVSDTGGVFNIGLQPGPWTVEPNKEGDIGEAVGAFDAAYVLQAVAHRRNLDALQTMACDVTGNGALTRIDAKRILQFAVDRLARLKVAERCGSDWLFVPEPLTLPLQHLVQPSLPTCQAGAISFSSLLGSASGQDFIALLLGDCTGNWNGGASAGSPSPTQPAEARLEPARGRGRRGWIVPLSITSEGEFVALTARIGYDPSTVTFSGLRLVDKPKGAMMRHHDDRAGLLALAMASRDPIASGDRQVALLFFDSEEEPLVQLLGVELDEVPAQLVDGSLTARAATLAP